MRSIPMPDPGGARTPRGAADYEGVDVNLVPRLLEQVRTFLLGRPEASLPTAADADREDGSSVTVRDTSPEMWGAILIHARRRRAQRQEFVRASARGIEPGVDSLVRAYVFPPDGGARTLAASAREAR